MSRLISVLGLIGATFLPLGCYATAGGYAEAEYVEVDVVPVHVETYPRYYYAGRTVYLVDGQWYYRHGDRWAYYRREPAELHRRRAYVERAPRAPERHGEHRRHVDREYHDNRDHHDHRGRHARPAEDRD